MNVAQPQHEPACLTDEQLQQVIAIHRDIGQPLADVLVSMGFCSESQALELIARQAGVPFVTIRERDLDPEAIALIPSGLAYRHHILPLSVDDHTIRVAVTDPFNVAVSDDIRMVTGRTADVVFANPQEIQRLVEEHYMRRMIADTTDEEVEILDDSSEELGDLERMAREATVIKFVNLILRQAVQDHASDVHVEPFEKTLRVRYRIDGVLHEISSPPKRLQPAVISRLKIMAGLDIAERRLPQDGRIKTKIVGREVDIRISTIPTLYGESVVLRLLDRSGMSYALETIGMLPDTIAQMDRCIKIPHGMILVTGPTGSGKSTTLYASLLKAYSPEKKVITIEDPVEYQFDGINQIQVHAKIGLTFAAGLRHILRHDPDIIMVGEIRDLETAEIAVHSALTGHLVFSTLHTNNAAGAITRLLEMGIEPYLVTSSVEALVAQRLVRTICLNCKEEYQATISDLSKIGGNGNGHGNGHGMQPRTLYRGRGCDRCKHTGYKGRTAIFEMLPVDDAIRTLVLDRAPATAITDTACRHGMRTLREDGWLKVLQGVTTVDEVVRVTQEDEIEVES
jgi:general secretion pathway protein E/type IV pilus assembly protein PilB